MYYKLVNGDLKSFLFTQCNVNSNNWQYLIQYKIDKFVYPIIKNSQLFVFADIQTAKEWNFNGNGRTRLFECEVINPRPPKLSPIDKPIFDFWKRIKNKKKTVRHWLKTGVIGCDAIKLTKEITQ
jgi:hypothetical protein